MNDDERAEMRRNAARFDEMASRISDEELRRERRTYENGEIGVEALQRAMMAQPRGPERDHLDAILAARIHQQDITMQKILTHQANINARQRYRKKYGR